MEKLEKSEGKQKQIIQNEGIIHFKDRLRQAMKGMSNVELAGMCGISETAIRTYLKGKSLPTIDKAAAIAEACEVNLEWLITGVRGTVVTGSIVKYNDEAINSTMNGVQKMLSNLNSDEVRIMQNYLNREGVNGLLRLIASSSASMDTGTLETIINALPLRPVLKSAIKIGLAGSEDSDKEILHILESIESRRPKNNVEKNKVG